MLNSVFVIAAVGCLITFVFLAGQGLAHHMTVFDVVSDHRINMTLYNLPAFMEGDMDQMINALINEDQAERLAMLEEEFYNA